MKKLTHDLAIIIVHRGFQQLRTGDRSRSGDLWNRQRRGIRSSHRTTYRSSSDDRVSRYIAPGATHHLKRITYLELSLELLGLHLRDSFNVEYSGLQSGADAADFKILNQRQGARAGACKGLPGTLTRNKVEHVVEVILQLRGRSEIAILTRSLKFKARRFGAQSSKPAVLPARPIVGAQELRGTVIEGQVENKSRSAQYRGRRPTC
jgi:hypothetical protein